MQHRITFVFIFIFTLFIVSPTVLSVVEKNFDISVLIDISEEENNQKEGSKTFDLEFSENNTSLSIFNTLGKNNLFDYNLKNYLDISLENTSPPPEFL